MLSKIFIPYDLTYKWILINKTRRQNITRDTEIKNKWTVTRGEMGGANGEKGEGFSGTTIKDEWTKPRGGGIRVGMAGVQGRGGEKGRKLYLNNTIFLNGKKFKK